jgi:Acetyltransferase (GNAT) domain
MANIIIDGIEIVASGRLLRTARVRAEGYECIGNPTEFLKKAKAAGLKADVFTFLQELGDQTPHHDFYREPDYLSVMPITTFDEWMKKQVNGKTRNMIRKAEKSGVVVKESECDDEFVRGIERIYNESPVRQGKPFQHYKKDFDVLKKSHLTYADRCQFVGAYLEGQMIGFIKLHHGKGLSSLMQIIAMVSARDKAPTNALIAKAVELCAARGVTKLHYGQWSRRTLGEFKKHHAFERYEIPRYFVPLSTKGKVALSLRLHRKVTDRLPGKWQDYLAEQRGLYYARKYKAKAS